MKFISGPPSLNALCVVSPDFKSIIIVEVVGDLILKLGQLYQGRASGTLVLLLVDTIGGHWGKFLKKITKINWSDYKILAESYVIEFLHSRFSLARWLPFMMVTMFSVSQPGVWPVYFV